MRFIYLFWSFQFMVSHGLPVTKRLNHEESRQDHVEIRLNLGLEELASLKEAVQVLNDILFAAIDTVDPVNDRGKGRFKNALVVKDEEQPTGELKERVLQALREEKMWVRIEIESLKKQADGLEMDFGDLQKDVNDAMEASNVTVETVENRLGTLITNEVGNLNTTLTHKMDDTDMRIKSLQSNTTQNQQTLEAMKEEVDKINTQSSIYSTLLENLESRIYDKLATELGSRMACPTEWRQFMGYCYILHTNAVDFDTAIGICSQTDGSAFVADIRSEDENEYLSKLSGQQIWIGITDREEEGKWTSVRNGKPLVYSNWDTNQPQNFAKYDEDCAAMTVATLRWHDYKCDKHKFPFVCKKMVA